LFDPVRNRGLFSSHWLENRLSLPAILDSWIAPNRPFYAIAEWTP